MRYEGDIYRPPGEWRSYLLQCTVGCSHNACRFCSMYKSKTYRVRPLDEVLEDIAMAGPVYGDADTVFLCDGDAIDLPTDYLLTVLDALYKTFPALRRVTTYAGPRSTLRKTPEELRTIRAAGLQRAYLGVETGDDALLKRMGKGVGAAEMLEAGQRLVAAGFDLWDIVLLGLCGAGQEAYTRSALATADIVNKMNPKHLSAMTLMAIPGTPLYDDVRRGSFVLQPENETLLELKLLIEHIELRGLHFTANHASNYVPLKGTLTEDRDKMLALLDGAISGKDTSGVRPSGLRRL